MCLIGGLVGGSVKTLKYGDDAINIISRVTNSFLAGAESLLSGGDVDDYLVAISLGFATGNEIELKGANQIVNGIVDTLLDKAANDLSSAYAQNDNGDGGIKYQRVVNWWNTPLKRADLANVPTYGITGVSGKAGITGLLGSAVVCF